MEIKNIFLLAVLSSLVFGICQIREAKADYEYHVAITINSGQVSNGPHTNFPFLFNTTNKDLKTTANGGHVTNGNGYDIIFKDASGNQLNHEIEKYDGTTGQFIAWVKVPSINNGTVIHIYYGNSSISTSQENKTGVWDSNYQLVQHQADNATNKTVTDSTSHNTGTSANNTSAIHATGQIGSGFNFNGSSDGITYSGFTVSATGTIEGWINTNSSASYQNILAQGSSIGLWLHSGKLCMYNASIPNDSQDAINDGGWHHFAVVQDGTNICYFLDGAVDGNCVSSVAFSFTANGTGRDNVSGGSEFLNGQMDELRYSNTARSADWIKTEFKNQSSPSSFYSFGEELGFDYRLPIKVNNSQVQNGPLTNFPFLFNSTNSQLATTGNGGHVTNANGYDIIFQALDDTTCGGTGKSPCTLDHEIERYNGTTGEFIAWVRVPSINTGTIIYVCYGNSNISTSQENKAGVWDTNYKAVWHLPDGTTLTANDSTIGGNNPSSINLVSAVPGKIGGGASFDGTNSWIDMGDGSINFSGNVTLESWVYPNAGTAGYKGIIIKTAALNQRDYGYMLSGLGASYIFVMMGKANPGDIDVSSHPWSAGVWNHIVVTADGSNIKIYINGNLAGSTSDSHVSTTSSGDVYLGDEYNHSYRFWGYLDEVRISNSARSVDWIKTEYNNQSAPSSFYTLGTQQVTGRFNYNMLITVNSNQLPSSVCTGTGNTPPLTNFPFLFNTTSANLKSVANGGHVESNNGYDIIFRALDSTTCTGAPDWDGTSCTLSHEIERYNASTGEFVAWIKVPSITNGTKLYIYYGNPDVTSSPENKGGVWDSNYLAAYHFPNGTSLTVNDSTSRANNLTNESSSVGAGSGQIDGGAVFGGTSSYALSGSAILSGNSQFTVSEWLKTAVSTSAETFGQFYDYAHAAFDMWISGGTIGVYVYPGGGTETYQFSSTSISDGYWHYCVGVFNGSTGNLDMYIDGALNNSTVKSGTIPSATQSSSIPLMIGAYSNAGSPVYYFNGSLDEVRISSTARSACWIATEYNNQSAPGSFYGLSGESSNPPTLITLASFDVTPQGGVEWQTKSEIDNLGFNLYRVNPDGTGAVKLNSTLIPGLVSSAIGKEYTYADTGSTGTVCYMLEDIDLQGASTYHGPVCTFQPAQTDGTFQETTGGGTFGNGSGSAANPAAPRTLPSSTGAVTAVKLISLSARRGPEGVLIEWQTGYEVHNLGFHVYRGHTRLTREPLLGSALFAGQHAVLQAGNVYSWFDPNPTGEAYTVEDIDLSGTRTLHGPVVPVPAQGPLPKKKTIFLSQLPHYQPFAPLPFRIWRMLAGGADFPGAIMSPQETQWALAQSAGLKLLVRQEGWYRITATQLAQAGFSSRQPRFLQLYVDGKEQPLLVTPTGIEFYATGVDTPWTDTRVYWLVNGLTPGKRIEQAGPGNGPSGAISFPATIVEKPRSFYFPALLNGDAQNWFGTMITQEQANLTLSVSHIAQSDAALDVLLQGVTDQPHAIHVFLNGSFLGNVVSDGQTQGHALFPVVPHQLIEGTNQVSFTSSGQDDVAAVDTLRLTYPHTYTADGNSLTYTATGGTSLTLSGFTAPVRTFDITDPQAVKEITGQIIKEGIRLKVPGAGQRRLLAVTEHTIQACQLTGNIPSSWHANHRADLLIITHGDFIQSLAPLVQLRQSQGLSVALIDVEDLYDEFSFGMKTPDAIKAFLSRARSWRTPPRYVLLVGGATYDPRNFTGMGDLDFIPTRLVDTAMIETASDDWFVDFNGDGLPEIPIGRLPVTTTQEAATVVAKLVAYEHTSPATKALYVADIGGVTDDFEGTIKAMEPIISLIPEELFRSKLQDQTAPMLLTELTKGAGLVLYLGHGSVQLWDNNVLDTTIATTLTNTTLPFFISLTCLNGYFIIPTMDSLAATLLTDTAGGAVGVIASSSLTEFAPQGELGTALLGDLFTGATAGEALVQAKRAVTDPDVRKSYLLFGDPSMRVRR